MNDRIIIFIQSLGISVSEFERLCSLSNGAVSKMGENTRKSTLDKISKVYPSLNTAWLRTGEGEMIKSSVSHTAHEKNSQNIIDGNGSHFETALLDKALDEISAMRQALTDALAVNQKNTDRLLSIIENMNNKQSDTNT